MLSYTHIVTNPNHDTTTFSRFPLPSAMPESCDRRVTIVVSHLSTKTLRLSVPFQESLTLAVEEFTLLPTPRKYHNLLCNMIEDVFCYALCFQHGTLGSDSSALFFVTDRSLSLPYFSFPIRVEINFNFHLFYPLF